MNDTPALDIGRMEDHLGAQIVAADPTQSVWVSANAGTGKTRVLVDRILRLLLAGTRPERILCLTFTKAAAAEMANRLSERLGEWALLDDPELDRDLHNLLSRPANHLEQSTARRLFAETLETPEGLKIRTIHSFCESLLGRFPLEAGIAPHFSVIDERTSAELRREARDRMLARAFTNRDPELSAALEHIAALVNEEGFASVMAALDGKRSQLDTMIRHHGDIAAIVLAIKAALGLKKDATLASILASTHGLDEAGLIHAAEALKQGAKTDIARAPVILKWLNEPAQRVALFEKYVAVFLTQKNEPRAKQATAGAKSANPALEDVLNAEALRLMQIIEHRKALQTTLNTEALLHVGQALLESYRRLKDARALVDYDDLILKARTLLSSEGGISWVHFKLDGGIEHILVDEAQDTSPEQWDVVRYLAEEFFSGSGAGDDNRALERTIFAVGDEKQSIYSFQGADPARFDEMRSFFAERAQVAGKGWRKVDLGLSFRSTRSILNTVDNTFSPSTARDGLSQDDSPVRHLPFRHEQAGLVELWPVVKPAEETDDNPWDSPLDLLHENSPETIVASRIADQVSHWLASKEILESAGRPIQPSDILILVRKRGEFADEMVRRLKNNNIPVAGNDRMVLTDQLAVMDLMALGQFALLPEDDLNLATVLKGPFIGLDEEQLYTLAYGRRGSLWQSLTRHKNDNPAFQAASTKLSGFLSRIDYSPPYEFYSTLLGPDGGRKHLLERLGLDAADPIDEFLSLSLQYEHEHVPSMQGFLHWIEAGATQIKRDLELGKPEVRVMTVHGSKGLQANIVFLPDTCSMPTSNLDSRLYWTEIEEQPLLLWPALAENEESRCQLLRDQVRATAEQEYRRLLYVAMTRARDRLYICGWEGKRERSVGCWYNLVAADLVENSEEINLLFGETGWRRSNPQTGPAELVEVHQGTTGSTVPLPAWATAVRPEEPDPPMPLAPSRPDEEDPPVRPPLGDDNGQRFRRGLLVHRLLQFLPDLDPEQREKACRDYLARPVHGLISGEQNEITRETINILNHPDYAPLFGPGSQAEVSLVGTIETGNGDIDSLQNRTISAQIDRLLITENEVIIVDYKTNRPPPMEARDVSAVYLRQMSIYRAALKKIYPDHKTRACLLWTDGPRLMELDQQLLDKHLP